MKSAYYAAVVTRAYRKELDRLVSGDDPASTRPFIEELYNVSHREFSTGFFYGNPDDVAPTDASYTQQYRFMGSIGQPVSHGRFELDVKNGFGAGEEIEYLGPDIPSVRDGSYTLYDRDGVSTEQVTHHGGGQIRPGVPVEPGFLIRQRK